MQPNFNPYATNLNVIKDYFKKPRVLIMIIAKIVYAALYCVFSFFFVGFIYNTLLNAIYTSNIYKTFADSSDSSSFSFELTYNIGSAVISLALVILPWILIYKASRNPSAKSSPKAGIIIEFISSILRIVSCGAMFLATGIIALVFYFAIWSTKEWAEIDIDFLLPFLTAIVVFLFLLAVVLTIHSIFRLKFISGVKKTLSTTNLYKSGSAYGVMTLILSVAGLIAAFFYIGVFVYYSSNPAAIADSNAQQASVLLANTINSPTLAEAFRRYGFVLLLYAGILIVNSVEMIFRANVAIGYSKHIKSIMNVPPTIVDQNVDYKISSDNDNFIMLSTCPQCKGEIKPGDHFCENCGFRVQ